MRIGVLALGPSTRRRTVDIVGVLSSHDQDIVDALPAAVANELHYPGLRNTFALEVRALHQTTEHRQVVAVPVRQCGDGNWVRREGSHSASQSVLMIPGDSRQREFLSDLSGYAYDPAVVVHDLVD